MSWVNITELDFDFDFNFVSGVNSVLKHIFNFGFGCRLDAKIYSEIPIKPYKQYKLPIDTIIDNLHLNWSWRCISANPNITWDDVINHLNLPWEWDMLTMNPSITFEIIKSNPDANWDYGKIIHNPNITDDIIQDNPSFPWDHLWINLHKSNRETFIEQSRRYNSSLATIFANDEFTETDLQLIATNKHPLSNVYTLEEVYSNLSCNERINWAFIKANLDKPWRFDYLSRNSIITYDIIQEHPHLPWDYSYLSCNPNITWKHVMNNPNKKWDYNALSGNPNITWEIAVNNLDKNWNFYRLSHNHMNWVNPYEQLSYVLK